MANQLIVRTMVRLLAKQIWNEVSENIEEYPYLKSEEVILRESVDPEKVIRAVLQILLRIQKEY